MATTEQRTGFRLPWASEPRSEPVGGGAGEAVEGGSEIGATSSADPGTGQDPGPAHAVEPAAHTPLPEATVSTDPGTATVDPRSLPWPSADGSRPGTAHDPDSGRPPASHADIAAPAPRRRDNPLVAGLVRAMRDAALAAREETTAHFADDAKGRVEAVRAAAAAEVTAARRIADEDIAAVREWSKAEMARIRDETEQRIAGRRRRLELELEDHAARVERRVERVQQSIASFEAAMTGFFERLLAEEDPARLAGLAEQMPEPPGLDVFDDETWASSTLDSAGAAVCRGCLLRGGLLQR